jgi:hypothetical protein
MDAVNSLIEGNKDVFDLTTKENVAELVNAYLDSKEIRAGSEHKMFAYYFTNWNDGVDSKVYRENRNISLLTMHLSRVYSKTHLFCGRLPMLTCRRSRFPVSTTSLPRNPLAQ